MVKQTYRINYTTGGAGQPTRPEELLERQRFLLSQLKKDYNKTLSQGSLAQLNKLLEQADDQSLDRHARDLHYNQSLDRLEKYLNYIKRYLDIIKENNDRETKTVSLAQGGEIRNVVDGQGPGPGPSSGPSSGPYIEKPIYL